MKTAALLALMLLAAGCGSGLTPAGAEALELCGYTVYIKDGHYYAREPVPGREVQSRYFPKPLKAGTAKDQGDGFYLLTWGGYGNDACAFQVFAD